MKKWLIPLIIILVVGFGLYQLALSHGRVAVVQPDERIDLVAERLAG